MKNSFHFSFNTVRCIILQWDKRTKDYKDKLRQRTEELESLKAEIVRRCENSPADLSFLQIFADRQQENSSRRPRHRARTQSDAEPPRLCRRHESRPETPVNGHSLPTEPSPVPRDPRRRRYSKEALRLAKEHTLDISDRRAVAKFMDEVRRMPSPCPSTASSASYPPRPIAREKPTERNRSVSRDSGTNGSGKPCSSYEELMASSKELTPATGVCFNDFSFR